MSKLTLSACLSLFICLCCSAAAAYAAGPTIDNEHVRVLTAIDHPHHKSALHRHELNRVMIYLDAGDLDVNYEDGRVDHQHRKVNDVAWSPTGGRHISENVGAKDVRIVEVELKKAAPASKLVRLPKLDPLLIDPAHNKLTFENDQVRVFHSVREPGSEEKMHQHVGAGRLVVCSRIWTAAPPPPTEKPAPCAALAVTLSGAKEPLRTRE